MTSNNMYYILKTFSNFSMLLLQKVTPSSVCWNREFCTEISLGKHPHPDCGSQVETLRLHLNN